ncbi:MAG: IS110 family transposase [Rhodospirillaceae bacterium]|jgi:transposase|nr:IS110 family transposase [Rhodospirillaceae bacterium]
MTYYAALDVGLHKTAVCIVDEDGAVLAERMIASEVDDLIAFLQDFGEEISIVGLEAGTLTQWLTYGLRDAGYHTVVMEARHVKSALGAMRNKTDRNDARGIAQILRTGWYREVYVKSLESHYTRTLLASRKALLSKCVDLENEVRGLLKVFGIKLRAGLGHGPFDKAAREPIMQNEALAYALMPLLEVRLQLYQAYLELDLRVKRLASNDPVCLLLMTTPGVGAITALTFRAAVDDPRRFRRSRTVAAHFGLTPRRYQSGERDSPGHISKAGDPGVRAALYAAANSIMTRSGKWSSLKAWGMRLQRSKGRKRALVAVARKLAVILHVMWVDGTVFSFTEPEAVQ